MLSLLWIITKKRAKKNPEEVATDYSKTSDSMKKMTLMAWLHTAWDRILNFFIDMDTSKDTSLMLMDTGNMSRSEQIKSLKILKEVDTEKNTINK